jgi:hypothetical protein
MTRRAGGLLIAVGVCLIAAALAPAVTRHGGPGPDRLVGTKKADVLDGKGGADTLLGKKGADRLIGGPGADTIVGGKGRDQINSKKGVLVDSAGNDLIKARDGTADVINCGAGDDKAIVDRVEDGVFDCEKVKEP